jgi:hypothetical protein
MGYCMSNMVVGKGIKNAKQIVSKILAHSVFLLKNAKIRPRTGFLIEIANLFFLVATRPGLW